MRKHFTRVTILIFSVACFAANAQGGWTKKANFAGPAREGAVGFSIGTKGYIGTGLTSSSVKFLDFWEYNPQSNAWTQKANFPGAPRGEATGFSIGGKGYIGFGFDGHTIFSDFWEYDPGANIWALKNSSSFPARYLTASFSIGNKGYIGTGISAIGDMQDFWEYDPTSDSWSQKANFGGSARRWAVGFSLLTNGYIGLGWYGGNYLKDFWRYDPFNDSWTQIANYPGIERGYSVAFSIDSDAYVGTGYNYNSSPRTLYDFWKYSEGSNSWSAVPNYGGGNRGEGIAFTINEKGYVGTGCFDSGISYTFYNGFWEYSPNMVSVPEINDKNVISIFPNPFSDRAILKTENTLHNATLTVNNSAGKTVVEINNISGQSITLNRDDLPSGVYFIRLEQGNATIATKKILINDR